MELMQKYVKDDGMVGVDDVDRWPVDSDAFGFLSAISTTESIETLKQVSVPYASGLKVEGYETDGLLATACSQKTSTVRRVGPSRSVDSTVCKDVLFL